MGRKGEQFEFEAEDDLAAVSRVLSAYAGLLATCDSAMLSSAGGRLIWRKRVRA